jgi:hypothetical protein
MSTPHCHYLKKKDLNPTNFNEAFHINNANTCGLFEKNISYVIWTYGQVKSNIPDQQEAKVADLHLL